MNNKSSVVSIFTAGCYKQITLVTVSQIIYNDFHMVRLKFSIAVIMNIYNSMDSTNIHQKEKENPLQNSLNVYRSLLPDGGSIFNCFKKKMGIL